MRTVARQTDRISSCEAASLLVQINMNALTTELLIATRNAGKLIEVRSLLSDLPVRLLSLSEFPETTEVEETGETFAENAALKARVYATQTRRVTLADDSGLEVDALGGAPGVFSARYAGEGASDAERNARLLSDLARAIDRTRRARFVCSIAIADAEARVLNISTGICEGRIADEPHGANGFGYDPLFIPDGYAQTFGQLSQEIKKKISHRARALANARAFLLEHFRHSA
jgi:XTP/dITP diphosphohydrolase